MMGLQLTNQLPFHTVYLHAMVRDKDGRKMSKSLGNVIDPLEVINGCTLESLHAKLDAGNLPIKEIIKAKKDQEIDFPDGIPECGSDALRFGLLAYTVQGRDVNLDIKRVVGYRNFCNKLWNATRFALQFVSDFQPLSPNRLLDKLLSMKENSGSEKRIISMATRDKYMISRLMNAVEAVNDSLSSYKFGDAQMAAYSLWMDDICDVYLELIKPIVYDTSKENETTRWMAQATLWISLECGLRLLHPMMPFVTEELWQRLPGRGTLGDDETETIMLAQYPQCIVTYKNVEAEASMTVTMNIIKACRSLRSSYQIGNKKLTKFYVSIESGVREEAARDQINDIITLGKAEIVHININDESSIPKSVGIVIVDETITVKMDLTGLLDYDAEIKKLEKSLSKTLPVIQSLEMQMNAPGYDENVTDEFKIQNTEKLEGLKKKAAEIELAIDSFNKMKEGEERDVN